MLIPVAVSTDIRRDEKGRQLSLWVEGSTISFSVGPFNGEQIDYKPGGTAGFSSMVYINYPRKLAMALLLNTQTQPFWLGHDLLKKLTPVLAKSLERRHNQALMEALPSWQKYTGRYVITDSNAVQTLTFSEFDISIVNQQLVVSVPKVLPRSLIYLKETPMVPVEGNVFRVDHRGLTFYGNLMTFESNKDGGMVLKWRNHVFKRQP
jgi:hypothetical protein